MPMHLCQGPAISFDSPRFSEKLAVLHYINLAWLTHLSITTSVFCPTCSRASGEDLHLILSQSDTLKANLGWSFRVTVAVIFYMLFLLRENIGSNNFNLVLLLLEPHLQILNKIANDATAEPTTFISTMFPIFRLSVQMETVWCSARLRTSVLLVFVSVWFHLPSPNIERFGPRPWLIRIVEECGESWLGPTYTAPIFIDNEHTNYQW